MSSNVFLFFFCQINFGQRRTIELSRKNEGNEGRKWTILFFISPPPRQIDDEYHKQNKIG